MNKYLNIDGCINSNPDESFSNESIPASFGYDDISFKKKLKTFKKKFIFNLENRKPISYLRYSDGEACFLKGEQVGSASPGNRCMSKHYGEIDLDFFYSGVLLNDYIAVELSHSNREGFSSIFPNKKIHYPFEYIYGLCFNKWFYQLFSNKECKVAILGAKEKLILIKDLMNYEKYRDYVKLNISDYIHCPMKFAVDDAKKNLENFGKQIKKINPDVLLVGIGQSKLGILSRLKEFSNALILDVGHPIDGLAGLVDHQRPYAAGWLNFKTKYFRHEEGMGTYSPELDLCMWSSLKINKTLNSPPLAPMPPMPLEPQMPPMPPMPPVPPMPLAPQEINI